MYKLFNYKIKELALANFKYRFSFFFRSKLIYRYSGTIFDWQYNDVFLQNFVSVYFGLKQGGLVLPMNFFTRTFPSSFKDTKLLFWKDCKFLIYNSFTDCISNYFCSFNLVFLGYFPFNFFNSASWCNFFSSDKFSLILKDIFLDRKKALLGNGRRFFNDYQFEIDNHISLDIFNNFFSYELGKFSIYKLLVFRMAIVSDIPFFDLSFFIRNFTKFSFFLPNNFFKNMILQHFFFHLKSFFICNLFLYNFYYFFFYRNFLNALIFRFKIFIFSFLKNFIFFKVLFFFSEIFSSFLFFKFLFKFFLFFKFFLIEFLFLRNLKNLICLNFFYFFFSKLGALNFFSYIPLLKSKIALNLKFSNVKFLKFFMLSLPKKDLIFRESYRKRRRLFFRSKRLKFLFKFNRRLQYTNKSWDVLERALKGEARGDFKFEKISTLLSSWYRRKPFFDLLNKQRNSKKFKGYSPNRRYSNFRNYNKNQVSGLSLTQRSRKFKGYFPNQRYSNFKNYNRDRRFFSNYNKNQVSGLSLIQRSRRFKDYYKYYKSRRFLFEQKSKDYLKFSKSFLNRKNRKFFNTLGKKKGFIYRHSPSVKFKFLLANPLNSFNSNVFFFVFNNLNFNYSNLNFLKEKFLYIFKRYSFFMKNFFMLFLRLLKLNFFSVGFIFNFSYFRLIFFTFFYKYRNFIISPLFNVKSFFSLFKRLKSFSTLDLDGKFFNNFIFASKIFNKYYSFRRSFNSFYRLACRYYIPLRKRKSKRKLSGSLQVFPLRRSFRRIIENKFRFLASRKAFVSLDKAKFKHTPYSYNLEFKKILFKSIAMRHFYTKKKILNVSSRKLL